MTTTSKKKADEVLGVLRTPRSAARPKPRAALTSRSLDQAMFEEVKGKLLIMSAAQKRDVIKLLGGSTVEAEQPAETTNARLLHAEMSALLEKGSGAFFPPFEVSSKSLGPDMRAGAAAFDAYLSLRHTGRMSINKVERIACYKYLCHLVLEYLRMIEVAVTGRTLMQQAANIAVIVDRSFPGYSESGLMPVVLQQACGLKPPPASSRSVGLKMRELKSPDEA